MILIIVEISTSTRYFQHLLDFHPAIKVLKNNINTNILVITFFKIIYSKLYLNKTVTNKIFS
jgi:hypothetical protein